MKSKLKKQIVLDEGCCPNPKQPGPQGAAILLLLSFLTSSFFSPLLSLNSQNGGMEGALVGAASGAATANAG
ncbi:hypothetical protein LEP1GSC047_2121 [Leptospira inadai serovar Lyme str. 10]|uniref:Uncharacterized protein n=2 Tax=Leptospira inadai serovar Lyme TaxID=293084 RepID=V6HNM7_9LEPT|nr:hypothetical protein [Leptospira inadai]EQA38490.1 hypothetical protein LEP1GSC047_2121 [Leptospira inadai serovar Lyme str. 10]PNV72627.1 hypothetical protein BES34_018885 [Leptospira inadai serovar Lyme]